MSVSGLDCINKRVMADGRGEDRKGKKHVIVVQLFWDASLSATAGSHSAVDRRIHIRHVRHVHNPSSHVQHAPALTTPLARNTSILAGVLALRHLLPHTPHTPPAPLLPPLSTHPQAAQVRRPRRRSHLPPRHPRPLMAPRCP